jgi:hypothetical protein
VIVAPQEQTGVALARCFARHFLRSAIAASLAQRREQYRVNRLPLLNLSPQTRHVPLYGVHL